MNLGAFLEVDLCGHTNGRPYASNSVQLTLDLKDQIRFFLLSIIVLTSQFVLHPGTATVLTPGGICHHDLVRREAWHRSSDGCDDRVGCARGNCVASPWFDHDCGSDRRLVLDKRTGVRATYFDRSRHDPADSLNGMFNLFFKTGATTVFFFARRTWKQTGGRHISFIFRAQDRCQCHPGSRHITTGNGNGRAGKIQGVSNLFCVQNSCNFSRSLRCQLTGNHDVIRLSGPDHGAHDRRHARHSRC